MTKPSASSICQTDSFITAKESEGSLQKILFDLNKSMCKLMDTKKINTMISKLELARVKISPAIEQIVRVTSIYTEDEFKEKLRCNEPLFCLQTDKLLKSVEASCILSEVRDEMKFKGNKIETLTSTGRNRLTDSKFHHGKSIASAMKEVLVNKLSLYPTNPAKTNKVLLDQEMIRKLMEVNDDIIVSIDELKAQQPHKLHSSESSKGSLIIKTKTKKKKVNDSLTIKSVPKCKRAPVNSTIAKDIDENVKKMIVPPIHKKPYFSRNRPEKFVEKLELNNIKSAEGDTISLSRYEMNQETSSMPDLIHTSVLKEVNFPLVQHKNNGVYSLAEAKNVLKLCLEKLSVIRNHIDTPESQLEDEVEVEENDLKICKTCKCKILAENNALNEGEVGYKHNIEKSDASTDCNDLLQQINLIDIFDNLTRNIKSISCACEVVTVIEDEDYSMISKEIKDLLLTVLNQIGIMQVLVTRITGENDDTENLKLRCIAKASKHGNMVTVSPVIIENENAGENNNLRNVECFQKSKMVGSLDTIPGNDLIEEESNALSDKFVDVYHNSSTDIMGVEDIDKAEDNKLIKDICCSPRIMNVKSALRIICSEELYHPNSLVNIKLHELGLEKLINLSRPADCASYAILNNRRDFSYMPFKPSLNSLPLSKTDMAIIQENVERMKILLDN